MLLVAVVTLLCSLVEKQVRLSKLRKKMEVSTYGQVAIDHIPPLCIYSQPRFIFSSVWWFNRDSPKAKHHPKIPVHVPNKLLLR